MAVIINLRDASNPVAGATGAIPNSTLQVTDLWPNVSQRNQIYSPVGLGPYYVNRCDLATVAQEPNVVLNVTTADTAGLTAYLIANVDDGAGANVSSAIALGFATTILGLVFTGVISPGDTALDLSLGGAIFGPGVGFNTTSTSQVQHVVNVLEILAGATFTLPAGTGNNTGVGLGVFNTNAQNEAQFNGTKKPRIADTDSSLNNSILNGQLSFLGNDALDLFGAAAAARVVQVYGDDGSLLM